MSVHITVTHKFDGAVNVLNTVAVAPALEQLIMALIDDIAQNGGKLDALAAKLETVATQVKALVASHGDPAAASAAVAAESAKIDALSAALDALAAVIPQTPPAQG